jgi:hypothetical protein
MPVCAPRGDDSASLDINHFALATGRMPRLGDEVPPWHYRGWLLNQVQLADDHPKAPGRWNHHMRILEAGRLVDEPIPHMRFIECPKPDGRKMLEKCIHLIAQRESAWTAFRNLIEWLAWGLAVAGNMPRLDEATNEALYRSFNLEPLLVEPHDYLGSMLSERRSGGWKAMKWVQLNCRISDTTISSLGKTSANCIIRRKFFSPKLGPYSRTNCRASRVVYNCGCRTPDPRRSCISR